MKVRKVKNRTLQLIWDKNFNSCSAGSFDNWYFYSQQSLWGNHLMRSSTEEKVSPAWATLVQTF